MDSSIWIAVGALVTALASGIAALATARVERRKVRLAEEELAFERAKTSGEITTTAADALWKESGDLRRAYQNEISQLRQEIESIRLEHAREKIELLEMIQSLRSEVREKDGRIQHLEEKNTKLSDRVHELEMELQKRLEAAHSAAATLAAALPAGGAE